MIALLELIVNVFEALGLLADLVEVVVWLGDGLIKAWCWAARR